MADFQTITGGTKNVTNYNPSYTATPAPVTPTLVTPPTPSVKTVTAPAVHSATPAITDVNNMQNVATANNQAIAQHQANVAANVPTPATPTVNQTPPTPAAAPTSEDISNAIMATLGGGSGAEAKTAGNAQISNSQANIDAQNRRLNGDPTSSDLSTQVGLYGIQDQVNNTLSSMANGSIPLTDAQKAQVADIKNQFQSAMADAVRYSQNVAGGAQVRDMLSGSAQYSPVQAANDMLSAIKAGQTKVGQVNTKMVDAQNKLTTSLQDQNYKASTAAFTRISSLVKESNDAIAQANADIAKVQTKLETQRKDTLTALMDLNTINHQDKLAAIAQSTLDEKTKNDLSMRAIAQENLNLKRAAASGSAATANLPVVQTGTDGIPVPKTQTDFLTKLPSGVNGQLATQVKGLANYEIDPTSFATRQYTGSGALTRADVIALAKQFDPSFSESQYAVRKNYLNKLHTQTGTNLGAAIASSNTIISHLSNYTDALDKIGNAGASSHLNALINTGRQINHKDLQNALRSAETAQGGIAEEMSKFYKGTGSADVPSTQTWMDKFNTAATPGDVQGTITTTAQMMLGKLDAASAAYQQTMGKAAPPGTFISPEALAKLGTLNTKYDIKLDLSAYEPQSYIGINLPDSDAATTKPATYNGVNLPN